ncbi:MAG: hypothetical protein ACM34H_03945 [Deltaproteobacteria bacterium]
MKLLRLFSKEKPQSGQTFSSLIRESLSRQKVETGKQIRGRHGRKKDNYVLEGGI